MTFIRASMSAEVPQRELLELQAQLLGDHLGARERGDVLQRLLAPVAEARGLDRADRERPAQLVHDERGQRFALHLLGDDEERLSLPGDLLQDPHQVGHGRDLLLGHQDVGLVERRLHPLGAGDEVGRHVPAVELHPLHDIERRLQPLRLLDGDDALLPHLLHRLGDDVADGLVAVGADRPHLGDVLLARGGLRLPLQLLDHHLDRLVDAVLQLHRAVARRDQPKPLLVDGAGEDRRRRRPVTGLVGRARRHLADHLGAHVLEPGLDLDLLGDGDAVLRYRRSPIWLLDDDVPSPRSQGHRDGLGEGPHSAEDGLARALMEGYFLGWHASLLLEIPKQRARLTRSPRPTSHHESMATTR
jgi:hypothetical protein